MGTDATPGAWRSSPRIDVRTLLSGARLRRRRGREHRGDPPARVGGVDHVVDLEVARHVHGLAVLVHAVDHALVRLLALDRVGDRVELAALAEADRTFEVHTAELAGGPGNAEQRRLERAAGHRLRAEAVA